MPSLFHIIDEESLSKNPNLKFDPQNPSAHLQSDHPKFQELKEGLTPEQIEILETVTQVDGFEVDDDKRVDDDVDMEFIDPDTGELEKFNADEFTLDELGFIDPSNLKKITMEAFNTERLDHINGLIQDRYNELNAKGAELFHKRLVSRLEANNVNALLGGTLYDNVVMESFTQYPTVVNYNVVMEEIDAGKTALAAGGAIIGVTILYKLIKWCLNAWNKNSVASGAIGANIKAIQERKDRLENATDVIKTAQDAFTQAQAKFTAATKDGEGISKKEEKKFRDLIAKINKPENLTDDNTAKEFLKSFADAKARSNLAPVYSNLWVSILTGSGVSVGSGTMQINQDFVSKMVGAMNACQSICNAAQAKLENIRDTATNATVDSDKDQTYAQGVQAIKIFAAVCGFTLNEANFNSSAPEFGNHVITQITAKVDKEIPEKPTQANFSMFTEETFSVITDEFIKQVNDFGDTLKDLAGSEGYLKGMIGKTESKVDAGADVQKDSRLTEYNKASMHFRGAMNVLRAIHSIRNNVGRGLVAINDGYDFLENAK